MTDIEPSPFEDFYSDDGALFPWAPQEGEAPLAYRYFSLYRSLPRAERSIAKAAREAGKSVEFFRELSPRFSWVDRAKAFDDHQERKAIEKLVQGRTAMREQHLDIAEVAFQKILTRLKGLDPDELSVRDAATFLDLSVKIARQSRGEADKTLRIEGEINVVDQLSTAERRALMDETRRVLANRLGRPDELEGVVEAEIVDEGDE